MWGKKLERTEAFIRVTARTACLSLSVQGLAGDPYLWSQLVVQPSRVGCGAVEAHLALKIL